MSPTSVGSASPAGLVGEQSQYAAWNHFGPQFGFNDEAPRPFVRIPSWQTPPSRGASEHNQGTCKPCAHNWKPAGCSNGADCEFCHACGEEDFKRCKKDKIMKLRDEG